MGFPKPRAIVRHRIVRSLRCGGGEVLLGTVTQEGEVRGGGVEEWKMGT